MLKAAKTGYELSFADFQRLLSDVDYRPSVARLLRRWFGYEIDAAAAGKSVRILSSDEVEIDMLSLHQQIQADISKQYDLYQTTMSLWR